MDEAIKLVDKWLSIMSERSLISSDEVADLLLDIRIALTQQPADDVAEPEVDATCPTCGSYVDDPDDLTQEPMDAAARCSLCRPVAAVS